MLDLPYWQKHSFNKSTKDFESVNIKSKYNKKISVIDS